MIIVTSIGRIGRIADCDERWAIVRSLKSKSEALKQVQALSPSTDLFYKYLGLRDRGEWNKDSFRDIYVPQFIRELNNRESLQKLDELFEADAAGKTIALACFCTEEELCHRSIIAGILSGAGCNVKTDSGKLYSDYFGMFQRVRGL